MVEKSSMNRSYRPGGLPGIIYSALIRTFQLVAALGPIVIYGGDVNAGRKAGVPIHPHWMYALIIGIFSLIVALVFLIPKVPTYRFFFLDALLAFFWLIVFGMFGKAYIPEDCEGNEQCKELKISVWFDLASFLLWTISAVVEFWFFNRQRINLHGGNWVDTMRGGRGFKWGYPHSNV